MQIDSSPRKARRVLVALVAALAALSLLASVATLGSARAETAARQTTPTLGHVFVLMGESQGLDKLTLRHAPYLVGSLKPRSAWLTDYRGVTLGGSLANYMGMTSGRFKKCDLNDALPDHCHFKGDNLFHQLDAAGMTWRSWMESMPHPCDFIDSGVAWWSDIYTVHHNPAMYDTNVQGGVYDEGITPHRECLKASSRWDRRSRTTRAHSIERSPRATLGASIWSFRTIARTDTTLVPQRPTRSASLNRPEFRRHWGFPVATATGC